MVITQFLKPQHFSLSRTALNWIPTHPPTPYWSMDHWINTSARVAQIHRELSQGHSLRCTLLIHIDPGEGAVPSSLYYLSLADTLRKLQLFKPIKRRNQNRTVATLNKTTTRCEWVSFANNNIKIVPISIRNARTTLLLSRCRNTESECHGLGEEKLFRFLWLNYKHLFATLCFSFAQESISTLLPPPQPPPGHQTSTIPALALSRRLSAVNTWLGGVELLKARSGKWSTWIITLW